MSAPAKPSLTMLLLGVVTLLLSSHGLYHLAHVYGAIPAPLAVLAVSGFDVFAIAAGAHALAVARDGDSPGPWNVLVVLIAGVAAGLQFANTQLAGQPWVVGAMMAFFPLSTVTMFEGALRRAARLNGRRTGRVAPPRATFELMQWLVYPRQTWAAFRLGVADRLLGADSAFKLGVLHVQEAGAELPPPQRLQLQTSYGQILGYGPPLQLGAGVAELVPPLAAGPSGVPRPEPANELNVARTVAELVRAAMAEHGPDITAVTQAVHAVNPEAKPDTISRAVRRMSAV